MFVVDTNVFVEAANNRSPRHAECHAAVERWRGQPGPWHTTWGVIYEFMRVVTHPRVFERPWTWRQAWRFVEALLASPGFSPLVATARHADIAAEVVRELPDLRGDILHDAHIAILMREHGLRRIYTQDAHFARFGFIEAVDPALPRPTASEPASRYRARRPAGA